MTVGLLAASLAGAAPAWVRLEAGRFEVYSTAGERPARAVLERLRQGERVFRDFVPHARGMPLPVRAYVFGNEAEYRPYRPTAVATAFYQSGPLRAIVALHYRDERSLRSVMHEFVHLVLWHSAPRLPRWLEEGTAEFYSTLCVTGDRVRLGGVIPSHLARLSEAAWLDAAALDEVSLDSPEYQSRDRAGLFYAQSWALTHMLNCAPAYRERMARFVELLTEGRASRAAFAEAFGRPMEEALGELRAYVRERRFAVVERDAGPPPEEAFAPATPVSSEDAEHALAELAQQTGRRAEAEKSYRKLARKPERTAGVEGRLGLLALRLNRDEEALAHLRRAIDLGSRDAAAHFEYAMLRREKKAPRAEVASGVRRAIDLNPNYAEAHFLLGLMASEEHRPAEAMEHYRRAARILPRQSQFWHALAVTAHEVGDEAEARRAARRARDTAANAREREMAEAVLRLVTTPPAPRRAQRPAVVTPPSWENPKGDRKLEGTLKRIDCLGQAARFLVTAGGRDVALYVARPGEVLLRNSTSVTFEFRCGAQQPRAVAIEYLARPDARLGTEGEITSIEFR
jgi:tetratricopeptide (TPR) repeat protein